MTDSKRLEMLMWRDGILDLVLDTDAATEVDDPFAISYVLLSPERFRLHAIYAAPFAMNERAQDPADGMEQSYQEILHVMRLCGREGCCPVFRGSARWLGDRSAPASGGSARPGDGSAPAPGGSARWLGKRGEPVVSPAAEDLAARALEFTSDHPLYVLAIGAGTNIASALLLHPEICDRIVVVWLAGDDFADTPDTYNIYQDRRAAQVIFDSGVPLIHVPCNPVTSHMITSVPELEACIGGKNAFCDYLVQSVREYGSELFAWGKTIWDLGAAGCLYRREWSRWELVSAPVITEELTWSRSADRHLIANVRRVDRDVIFRDAFRKMGAV